MAGWKPRQDLPLQAILTDPDIPTGNSIGAGGSVAFTAGPERFREWMGHGNVD